LFRLDGVNGYYIHERRRPGDKLVCTLLQGGGLTREKARRGPFVYLNRPRNAGPIFGAGGLHRR